MEQLFFDSLGNEIKVNDVLQFANGHLYVCLMVEEDYHMKCLSKKLPLLKIKKICLGDTLVSATIIKKHQ